MIDPHAHLRDWNQSSKETLNHGLRVAFLAGLDAVFEMPNTDPPLTTRENIERRIHHADLALETLSHQHMHLFHGLYAGLTSDEEQIREVVKAYNDLFPRVVGLKMFAGNSTGNMGIVNPEDQLNVYKMLARLGYKGVLAVHCEKESMINSNLFDPSNPFSHTLARRPEAEIESGKDQLSFVKEVKFKGTLHICHISMPSLFYMAEQLKSEGKYNITTGVTPHHLMLHDDLMKCDDGLLLKMNPPLRQREMAMHLIRKLREGRIDWIETDHAPHTINEKMNHPYASGIPVFPYYPVLIESLKSKHMFSDRLIENITHNNIVNAFRIDIKNTKRKPHYNLANEYEFDPFMRLKGMPEDHW